MKRDENYLALTDKQLLGLCEVQIYRSSGPGGQHRNKVSSAVRLVHQPTGITVHGDERRSQHENKRVALRRLRRAIACKLRRRIDPTAKPDKILTECLFTPRGQAQNAKGKKKLQVGKKDSRFWPVAAVVLDALETFGGALADTAAYFGISTANLADFLTSERHLFVAAQEIRKAHGLKPLS